MRATNAPFRFLGMLIVVLTSLIARAEGNSEGNSDLQIVPLAATQDAGRVHLPTPAVKNSSGSVAPAPIPASSTTAGTNGELATERYPNGNVKIERQVTRDANANYINQGTYKAYDLDGKVQKTGEFVDGKQQGKWTQSFAKDDGHLFSADHDTEFSGPFVSEATFIDGQLHGAWTIKNQTGRSIVAWNFDNGVRDGKWTWWYPNGEKRLEATFHDGKLDGDVLEYNQDGRQAAKDTYIDGMHLTKTVGWYVLGQKHFEGYHLRACGMPEPTYDWWKGTVVTASVKSAEKDLQHGAWIEWYQSGNKKTEAQYDHGVAIGRFTWWYENGQKKAEVDYRAGVLGGTWVTWHPNGLKESQAEFREGELADQWMHWDADGKLVEMRQFNQPASPQASKPTRTANRQSPAAATRTR